MRPAEFRCAREFLGLSAQWIANRLNVTPWTVSSWERIGSSVPEYAAEFMDKQLQLAEQTVGAITLKWSKKHGVKPLEVSAETKQAADEPFPPSYQRAIASRVNERINVGIDYKTGQSDASKRPSPGD